MYISDVIMPVLNLNPTLRHAGSTLLIFALSAEAGPQPSKSPRDGTIDPHVSGANLRVADLSMWT